MKSVRALQVMVLIAVCGIVSAALKEVGADELLVDAILALREAASSSVAVGWLASPAQRPSTPSAGMSVPALQAGQTFSDRLSSGGLGPEMVVIPSGRFRMGCVSGQDCSNDELPVHDVTIPRAFAVSKYEVTFEDYDRFTYWNWVDDEGWGRDRRPVINVPWNHAQKYVAWLSRQTGHTYRLLSEAEWEYVARAGSSTAYSWGDDIGTNQANCADVTSLGLGTCGDQWEHTAPVGSFAANAFGVHDLHGNVWEWVEDCWNGSYADAPSDGGARSADNCGQRVIRGGTWSIYFRHLRSADRMRISPGTSSNDIGFRVARTLTP